METSLRTNIDDNFLYISALGSFLCGNISWLTDRIGVLLVDLDLYTPDRNKDSTILDIPDEAIVGVSLLTGTTIVNGAADATDTIILPVRDCNCCAVILCKLAEINSLCSLIAFMGKNKTYARGGLPVEIIWPNEEFKIFRL